MVQPGPTTEPTAQAATEARPAPAGGPAALPAIVASHPATADGHALLALEAFLPYQLSILSNRISQSIARLYEQRFGLAITEWRIMAVLGRFPDLSANEVAERTAMDKVAVSRALAKLLQRDLVRRDVHGDDRRRSVLALSEAGFRVYDEVAPLALDVERKLLAHLSDEERDWLAKLVKRLDDAALPHTD